jgi:hypothetical protein
MTENVPNFLRLSQPMLKYIRVLDGINSSSKGASTVINGYESITGQIMLNIKKPGILTMYSLINLLACRKVKTNFNARYKRMKNLSTMIFALIEKIFC